MSDIQLQSIAVVSSYEKLTDVMKGMLLELNKKETNSTKLSEKLQLSKTTTSRYLKSLRNFGLLESKRQGHKKLFRLTTTGIEIVKEFGVGDRKEVLILHTTQ